MHHSGAADVAMALSGSTTGTDDPIASDLAEFNVRRTYPFHLPAPLTGLLPSTTCPTRRLVWCSQRFIPPVFVHIATIAHREHRYVILQLIRTYAGTPAGVYDFAPINLSDFLIVLRLLNRINCELNMKEVIEEIVELLLGAALHNDWLSPSIRFRPGNGSLVFYRRELSGLARRQDGYLWKRKANRRTAKEVHMVLKVEGVENPSIVLFHYLNVPSITKDDKLCLPLPVLNSNDDHNMSRSEVAEQLARMLAVSRVTSSPSSLHASYLNPAPSICIAIFDLLFLVPVNCAPGGLGKST
ncbi:unnamed protein product [Echinostoma caproni]|uniref:CG-1 domain-containing protein n=1 Tax=Echinostoma caproni TaxID=27848 RepID=A0A183AIH2_9TREM|nr:unnamed protein product [Echinostoma caproni]